MVFLVAQLGDDLSHTFDLLSVLGDEVFNVPLVCEGELVDYSRAMKLGGHDEIFHLIDDTDKGQRIRLAHAIVGDEVGTLQLE